MDMLKGKTALITGASRGIGAQIALSFAKQGADVAFTYLNNKEKAEKLQSELVAMGVKAKCYKFDVGDFASCEQNVSEILTDFNGLDICVNNAGISKDNLLLRMSEEQWDSVIRANLKSVFNMTKSVIKHMVKNKSGSIINVSSIVGIRGNAGQSSYAASKAGIIGFTKSIALEYGSRNIRCNAIAPGFVETDMTDYLTQGGAAENYLNTIPLKRFGTTSEIADVALFLSSNMSRYVTGQVISVCGGMNI